MIFFFLFLDKIISHQFCVCQPDRPGPVCTLEKKCKHFINENQILLINKKRSDIGKQSVNIHDILNKIHYDPKNQVQLEFDVFGSLPSKPIIFNFTKNKHIPKINNNIPITIKIKGGEWKQRIIIVGLGTESNKTKPNAREFNMSLSISDITVLFDQEKDNLLSSVNLESFSIQKSKLIVSKGKSFVFNTHDLFADTISSYSDFTGQIITNQLTYTDTGNLEIINKTQFPFQIRKNTKSDESKKVKKNILKDTSSPTTYSEKFNYIFCLTPKDNLEKAFEDSVCDMHAVPHDLDHYINIKSTDVIELIEKAPANEEIRFYLATTTSNNPCTFVFPNFETENHSVLFQIVDPDYKTYLTLKKSSLIGIDLTNMNIEITITSISQVNIDASLLSSFDNVTLRSSPIVFLNDIKEATIQNLVTDSQSISQFEGKLSIEKTILLRKTVPKKMSGIIYLKNNSRFTVPQISNFPTILFKSGLASQGEFRVSLCDADEYIEMSFFFDKGLYYFDFSDDIMTIKDAINLTFRSDTKTFDRTKWDDSPFLYFTTAVPSQGLNITFGTPQSDQWPRTSVFTFENKKSGFPTVYLTINDGQNFTNETITDSIFMNFYNVSVFLLTYESFNPFLEGLNKNYKTGCPYIMPHFVNPGIINCFQTGAYNVDVLTFDTHKILDYVKFEGSFVQLGVEGGIENKVPPVYQQVVVATSKDKIGYEVNSENFNIENLRSFQLKPSVGLTVNFTNDFVNCFRGHEEDVKKLQINHGSNDLFLVTNDEKSVPLVELDDQVQGVYFVTGRDDYPIEYLYESSSFKDSRIGPNVEVKFSQDITVPQSKFLAEKVAFISQGGRRRLTFEYFNKSACEYTFTNTNLAFVNQNRKDSVVNFEANTVTLRDSFIRQDVSSTKLNLEADYLNIFDIESIREESFSSPIIIHNGSKIILSKLRKIIFSVDSIQLFDENYHTPKIINIPYPDNNIENEESLSSLLLEDRAFSDLPSGFNVETNTDNQIDLVVDGNQVPEDFDLKLTGSSPNVFFDKSWNNVNVPDSFSISSDNKYTINTDLVELPKRIGEGNVVVKHKKQKLTKDIGFIVFIIIFAVVFIIAIILCVYGLTCMPDEEAYDMTSDLIEDSPKISQEKVVNVEDSESWDDDSEEEKKKENEEKGKVFIQTDEAKNENSNKDDETDTDSNFFDEVDNDTPNRDNVK